ncbi:MAG: hypothetical protein ACE5G0_09805 [Rhodothermales bacterium]
MHVLSSSFNQPILRQPSGGSELPLDQSERIWGGKVSWIPYARGIIAFEVGLVHWRANFEGFQYSDEFTQFSDPTVYDDPSVALTFVDLAMHVAPWRRVPMSVYGVLGMGAEKEKYRISQAAFSEWDGQKNVTEFQYSYGLGLRLFPVRYVSLLAEYRWVPGDLYFEGGSRTCYHFSSSAYGSWSSCGSGDTKYFTKLFSAGLIVSFP